MEKEELLSLIDKKVSKQGNQGATELGSILGSVVEYLEEKTGPKCLKFTSLDEKGGVGFIINTQGSKVPKDYVEPNIEYSLDNGNTWESYELVVSGDLEGAVKIVPGFGNSVLFRGVNSSLSYYLESKDDYLFMQCSMVGSFSAEGDVTSLLNGVGGDVPLAEACYKSMFSGCTNLTSAPALPSTILAEGCYESMFYGCKDLVAAPVLPATTLADSCYQSMFYGCKDLVAAPVLPATTLANSCYTGMFSNCTGLTSHHVATLNPSADMFDNNSACETFTIDEVTPPTIANNTITGLKADCIIYVPAESVDAYKAAKFWSARASYIQAKP